MSSGGQTVVLDWLRGLRNGTPRSPRRLIYALPPRSLVEPTAAQVAAWLTELGLADQIALHVVMVSIGGLAALPGPQWRRDMHRPAIVIGTTDALVSKALNRGYGISAITRSIDFALTTNGAHWVFDEASLCPVAVSTIHQLARSLSGSAGSGSAGSGSAEPFEISCVSRGQGATCVVRQLAVAPGDYRGIAAASVARHRPGTRTLIVTNTVAAARQVYTALVGSSPAPCVLVHTQFRGRERLELTRILAGGIACEGQVVVATQVVEAGLALDAALVATEAAPGLSLALRAGQCRGEDAELCWVAPENSRPYEEADVAASVAGLRELEGQAVTSERLAGLGKAPAPAPAPAVAAAVAELGRTVLGRTVLGRTVLGRTVLGRTEFVELFDTESDVDVECYLRDAEDLEAQLAWSTWEGQGCPPSDARLPSDEWRCRAPLTQIAALAARVPVWRMDRTQGRWLAVTSGERIAPGELLLIAAADGGYDPVLGFDPGSSGPVLDCPAVDTQAEPIVSHWVSLRQHSEQTRDQAAGLLAAIEPALPDAARAAVVCAAYLHDAGKAHPIWQDALCALAGETDSERVSAGRPWAKSGVNAPLVFAGDVAFRHELASLLLIDGPLRGLVDTKADRDLVRYLVLAHHGRLRVRVRDPNSVGDGLFGLESGVVWSMPSGLDGPQVGVGGAGVCGVGVRGAGVGGAGVRGAGVSTVKLAVDLEQFRVDHGGEARRSWVATVHGLLDRYGPFVLAYLETIVRVADWRSSGGEPLP